MQKTTCNLKFAKFEKFENEKYIEHNLKIAKVLYHM
jgi:hypothetical protein